MDEKKKKTVDYELPRLITQEIYLEQVIATSTPPPNDGDITEDWGDDNIINGDFNL